MCSPLAKKDAGSKQESAENGNHGAETDLRSEKGKGLHRQSNCIAESPTPTTIEVSQTNSAITNGHGNDDLSLRIGLPTGIAGG